MGEEGKNARKVEGTSQGAYGQVHILLESSPLVIAGKAEAINIASFITKSFDGGRMCQRGQEGSWRGSGAVILWDEAGPAEEFRPGTGGDKLCVADSRLDPRSKGVFRRWVGVEDGIGDTVWRIVIHRTDALHPQRVHSLVGLLGWSKHEGKICNMVCGSSYRGGSKLLH